MEAADEVPKTDDEWGKFYSMPPKWNKDGVASTPTSPLSKSGMTDENIGHRLASLLRYHLDDISGITTDDDGWVEIADILEHAEKIGLDGCTAEDLVRVAEHNEHSTRGRRFETDGSSRIKARYRHPPKDMRRGWDRDRGYSRGGYRSARQRDWNSGWRQYGWYDNGYDDWQDRGEEGWKQWKKPGFSPSPDDLIVKESKWSETPQAESSSSKAKCDWEEWFTPEMVPYFYNTKTEEVLYPNDVADAESKGWVRYEDTEGDRAGKLYWWHEATEASFYEDDTKEEAA